ncbi:MAG: hypothetical protein DRP51_06470, partial [Candidatus Zixiibacteriota bacterium]
MSRPNTSIFISAGDPSGDIAGSLLLKQLQQKRNDLEFFGLGGPRMKMLGQAQPVDGKKPSTASFLPSTGGSWPRIFIRAPPSPKDV